MVRAAGNPRACGFSRVPGFLYAERTQDVEGLANELDAARRAGCLVRWEDEVPLPFKTFGAVTTDDTVLLGFGLEQVVSAADRKALLGKALAALKG